MYKKNPYLNSKKPSIYFCNSLTQRLVKVITASNTFERLTVKGRTTKAPLPSHLEGLRKIAMSVKSIEFSYEGNINNKLEKSGLNCVHGIFEAEEGNTIPHAESKNGVYRVLKTDILKHYVRLYSLGHETKQGYECKYINIHNQIIVPTSLEKEEYFPKEYESKKQEGFDLSGNAQTIPYDYHAYNILYVQQGNNIYNNLTQEVLDLFDLEETE